MTNRIVLINIKKSNPIFGETEAGDVWFDPYKGVKILICCPNCSKRLYVLTKKDWESQKSLVADECCGASFSVTTQGFFISEKVKN